MKLQDLETAVRQHTGEFLCRGIGDEKERKVVHFSHRATAPVDVPALAPIGRLQDFYDTFGSLTFYYDTRSGDAARHIAAPSQWAALHADFSLWLDDLDEAERAEILPEWIDTSLVIGETPHSGNYILMPTTGHAAGQVFEFDHDGFEFLAVASDIVTYATDMLQPGSSRLVDFASHMRFVENEDYRTQWWICEMKDAQGRIVTTES